jgi:glucose-6-phosphate isomerase
MKLTGPFTTQIDMQAELHLGLADEGCLALQAEDRTVRGTPVRPGTVAYLPPMRASRTANTADEPFIFSAPWSGHAGHDYGTIEQLGFAKLLADRNGRATFIGNPRQGNRPP